MVKCVIKQANIGQPQVLKDDPDPAPNTQEEDTQDATHDNSSNLVSTSTNKRKNSKKSYTQSFKNTWLNEDNTTWLTSNPHDSKQSYCRICQQRIKGGITHINRHARSAAHQKKTMNISQNSQCLEGMEGTLSPHVPSTSSSQERSTSLKARKGKRKIVDNLPPLVDQPQQIITQPIHDTTPTLSTPTDNTDEYYAFGNYVAANLKRFQPSDAVMAEHEIQGIIYKYKIGQCQNNAQTSFIIQPLL